MEYKYNPPLLETSSRHDSSLSLRWIWAQPQNVCMFLMTVTPALWLNYNTITENFYVYICIQILNLFHVSDQTEWNTLSQSLKPPTVHTKSIKDILNHCQSSSKSHMQQKPCISKACHSSPLELRLLLRGFGLEVATCRFGDPVLQNRPTAGFGFFHEAWGMEGAGAL